ncbi:MAG: hypothetical protein U5R06_20820 [candidate division KSB1 bacterium]|nr:hypothetical protein [candidate division KSB1 bacterium]
MDKQNSIQIHMFHAQPFGLKELQFNSLAFSWSPSPFAVAAALKSITNPAYQEFQFYTAIAKNLPAGIDMGCSLRYGNVSIPGYGDAGSFMVDLGLQCDISSHIRYGFSASNVNYARLGTSREKIPQVLRTGVMITAGENAMLCMDLVKDSQFPLDIRAGAEYHVFDSLSLRFGSAVYPSRWSAGFTLTIWAWAMDYAYKSHSDLGITHLFSIQFDWRIENDEN